MSSINHHVTGQQYWRSLEQLAETPEVAELIAKEFEGYDADNIAATSRRSFMKLMGAAMAFAGITLTGCRRWPKEQLAPYSSNPRGIIPGVPVRYATSLELNGVASGLLVTSFDGRPIKIEGNPTHPSSATVKGRKLDDGTFKEGYGSADAFAQASILEMYDPDRSRSVIDRTQNAKHTTWEDFLAHAGPLFAKLKEKKGAGFAILSEATSSPSVFFQRKALLEAFPEARWYEYEALSRDNEREGTKLAFGKLRAEDGKFVPGRPFRTNLKLDQAKVVVSLDADLLGTHPNHTRYANDWAQTRTSADKGGKGEKTMSRVYVAESTLSLTGSMADVRIAVDPSRIYVLAYAIATHFSRPKFAGIDKQAPTDNEPPIVPRIDLKLDAKENAFVDSAVSDLKAAGTNGVVAIGFNAPPEAHVLVHAINGALGAVGSTVSYVEELDPERPTHIQAVTDLVSSINKGETTTLLMLGGNPAYDAPSDVNFAAALAKVPASIHLSLYDNETSRVSKWHLPRAHYLESWGDALSWDATVTLQQPLIMPLFGGKSVIEVLAMAIGDGVTEGYKIIRRTFEEPAPGTEAAEAFEKKFREALEAGFFKRPPGVIVDATLTWPPLPVPQATAPTGFTLRFEADSRVYDGRFANNGWLQETPDPLTKLVWDNALVMSVKDARELGLDQGGLVEITVPSGGKLTVPICLLPGQPNKVVSLSLGYGRTAAGPIGDGLGFNSYTIRTSGAPWIVPGVQLRKTGDDYLLVTSAEHHLLDTSCREAEAYRVGEKNKSGKIIREATLAEYNDAPRDLGGVKRKTALQLFVGTTGENHFRDVHAWGMTIDLTACIGCNACALACQAENNIPIVGKDQCYRHREMNWIRIDRYFKGDPEDTEPEIVFQPMACQHCENAPCEQVCPVAATVHDSEGLNTMVYNRCVGTRYCSNNCPYKVRRFNYFDYHAQDPRFGNAWVKMPWNNLPDLQQLDPKLVNPIKRMVFNPDVTVRMRGVMEKCTYCVQRIHGTVTAKRTEGKDIEDGDIITACQQACPTEAIVFGNLKDSEAKVSKLQKAARAFDVLQEELNTLPRTRYLMKLRNPVA